MVLSPHPGIFRTADRVTGPNLPCGARGDFRRPAPDSTRPLHERAPKCPRRSSPEDDAISEVGKKKDVVNPENVRFLRGGGRLAVSAHAGTALIEVDGGGSFVLQSSTIAGVFGAGAPTFTNAALNEVHGSLHDSGISTNGCVTVMLAETDHGLSLMTLVDDNTPTGWSFVDSWLGVVSHAEDAGALFVNDVNHDIQFQIDAGGQQTAAGTFVWDSDYHGDAMAWAGLNEGDSGDFCFTDFGCPEFSGDAFQFVSWNGNDWEVVATGDFNWMSKFSFEYAIIPVPEALGLGLAGFAGFVTLRRKLSRV
jgi:hypothetical protein